jgi:putative acetyltransferase
VTHAVQVRPAAPEDRDALRDLHRRAFGSRVEADLVDALLADPAAAPTESLVAVVDGEVSAHALLTHVQVEGSPGTAARILAPLAVVPEHQRRGLGTAVTVAALDAARAHEVVLVVVLGDPAFYSRFGFRALGDDGPAPPHPLPASVAGAWQTLVLRPGTADVPLGLVRPAPPLRDPRLWLP